MQCFCDSKIKKLIVQFVRSRSFDLFCTFHFLDAKRSIEKSRGLKVSTCFNFGPRQPRFLNFWRRTSHTSWNLPTQYLTGKQSIRCTCRIGPKNGATRQSVRWRALFKILFRLFCAHHCCNRDSFDVV